MKNKRGITLLEIIISIALIGMIFLIGTQLLTFSIRGHNLSSDEFDVQSSIRIASQHLNNTIRDSSGVFLLHRDNADNLSSEWNYFMLSPEKDKMLHYVWNSSTSSHEVKELFPATEGVSMELEFIKKNDSDIGKLMGLDFSVTGLGETRNINTEIEAKNALQVVDRSYSKTANTLAYRKDTRVGEVSNSQAAVTMVLDVSGSMAKTLSGGSATDNSSNPSNHSRMKLMKNEATRLVEELSELPNIYVGIIPFSSTANDSGPMMNAKQQLDTDPGLRKKINDLSAGGGTNTGDGIRRAYYNIFEFNKEHTEKTNKNFMIILVDGVTTYASTNKAESRSYGSSQGSEVNYNGTTYYYSHTTGILWWTQYHYVGIPKENFITGDGNITNSRITNSNLNTYYTEGRYYGHGSDLDPYGTAYVDLIGDMVQSYKEGTNEEIKAYVIGFSADEGDFGSLEDIAEATTGDTVYYEAGSAEALEEIFRAIQRDINDSLWHIGGPN